MSRQANAAGATIRAGRPDFVLMAKHLKIPAHEAESKLGDIDAAFQLWEDHCTANEKAWKNGQVAASNVHHFDQKAFKFWRYLVHEGVF